MKITRSVVIRNLFFIGLIFLPFTLELAVSSQRTVIHADPRDPIVEDEFSHPIFQSLSKPTKQLSSAFYAPATFVISTLPNAWILIAQRAFPKFLRIPIVLLFILFLYIIPLNLLYALGSRLVKKMSSTIQSSA